MRACPARKRRCFFLLTDDNPSDEEYEAARQRLQEALRGKVNSPKTQQERSMALEQKTDATYPGIDPVESPIPNQDWSLFDEIGVYGVSLQGSSHIRSGTPCQDNNRFCYLESEGILVAAIADGVGSCTMSHWGAYTAVNAVISVIAAELQSLSEGKPLALETLSQEQIETLFHTAFRYARDAVTRIAREQNQPEHLYQSTLTAAIYDGHRLACCHVGDDGIVAQGVSGNYRMITERIKGEEANSVVPLQSGRWQVTVISTEITGFLMSTDGVLDHYVSGKALGNRVYYPFFERRIYGMMPRANAQPDQAVRDIFERTRIYLQSDKFRRKVTDDITVLAAANQTLLQTGGHPNFSPEEWEKEGHRFREETQRKLYPGQHTAEKKADNQEEPPRKTQRDAESSARKQTAQDSGQLERRKPTSHPKEDSKTWFDRLMDWVVSHYEESNPPESETRRAAPGEAEFKCRSCGLRIIADKMKLPDMTDIRCPCCGGRLQTNSQQRSSSK